MICGVLKCTYWKYAKFERRNRRPKKAFAYTLHTRASRTHLGSGSAHVEYLIHIFDIQLDFDSVVSFEYSTRAAINRIITFYLLENRKQAICLRILIIISNRISFFYWLRRDRDLKRIAVQTHRFRFAVFSSFLWKFWLNSQNAGLAEDVSVSISQWNGKIALFIQCIRGYSLDLMESAAARLDAGARQTHGNELACASGALVGSTSTSVGTAARIDCSRPKNEN